MQFEKTPRNTIKRSPGRGKYEKELIHQILDDGFLCHVGFVVNAQPFVIPTCYGRAGDDVYLHGASTSRMLRELSKGCPVCVTVTHVDGLVLARSAFHHSVNYRSVVLFGNAIELSGDEKSQGLYIITENILKSRWDEVRKPNAQEMKATSVLRMAIDSASAKVRSGPPIDDDEDYQLPIWAGVVPITATYGEAQNDPKLSAGIDPPASVQRLLGAGPLSR